MSAKQSPSAPEARRGTRLVPPAPTPVVDSMSDEVLGLALDLSAGGLKLLASGALPENALFQVHFNLDIDGEGRVPLEAGVQVVSRRASAKGVVAGFRFIHLQGPYAQRLARWLQARSAAALH